MVGTKFHIIYCTGCLTTLCVPLRTLADNSLAIYGNLYKPCKCVVPCGVYYRTEREPLHWVEVEVDLDDNFVEGPSVTAMDRMDIVVGGID